jgi:hypothetical protein
MKKKFQKKILVFLFTILIIGSGSFPIINSDSIDLNKTKKDSEFQKHYPIIKNSMIDIQYIYNITENLSNIIFNPEIYGEGELKKGRAFGSDGEHAAAKYLADEMKKLGLYDPTDNSTPSYHEQIQNIPDNPKCKDLTHGYQVFDYKLNITNTTSKQVETVDCQISAINLDSPYHEQKNYTSFYGLKIKKIPKKPRQWIQAYIEDKKEKENYVFIQEHGYLGYSRNPDANIPLRIQIMNEILYPIRSYMLGRFFLLRKIETSILNKYFTNCKGLIIYDFINDTRDSFVKVNGFNPPRIVINGTIGSKIVNDIKHFTVDYYVNQMYNESIISYNVIGQINGTDPNKTVIVDCLYDSVWCQGTGDSAIGMAIVMGIAKYFKDNNKQPKYNIKFIGFGGEEAGCRGAKYYNAAHKNENIIYIIDMNQVGFNQTDPKLELNLICNNYRFMNEIWKVAKRTKYVKRTDNKRDITKRMWREGAPSDESTIAYNRTNCKTVCFLTDFPWILHHRDGLNHTEGDVIDYFDWNFTSATGEIALNITLYLTNKSNNQDTNNNIENYFLNKTIKVEEIFREH